MRSSRKGFTLLELMIVVAILGILTAIAIPNFVSFKRKAIIAAAVANLENARLALSNYAASQSDWCFPPATNDYAVFLSTLSSSGLSLPDNPSGVKWASFDGYSRDPANCILYTVTITAADAQTQLKALPKGVCCVDGANCTSYANNLPQCTIDFGI